MNVSLTTLDALRIGVKACMSKRRRNKLSPFGRELIAAVIQDYQNE